MPQTDRVKSAALVLVALLPFSLAGCGGTDEPADGKTPSTRPSLPVAVGTVQGRIVTSGGPAGAEEMAVPGTVRIAGADGSVTTADTGESGRFAIQLAPGDYTVTATSPNFNGGTGTCTTEPAVTTLRADTVSEVDVVCSIR